MLTIRLLRIGKKKQPSYKVIVTDKRNSPSAGRFIEEIGFYNPITKDRRIDANKAKYWISKGATISDTVYNILVTDKVIEGSKIPKHKASKKTEEATGEGKK